MRRLVLVFVIAALGIAGCDRFEGLTVRNDTGAAVIVTWQLPGGRENPVWPYKSIEESRLEPGSTAEAGKVGGPPDPAPDVIVKAYDSSGTQVYCRRFSPSEYGPLTSQNPLSIKAGDLRCK